MKIDISLNRGRTAGYPTAPSQIPASGVPAPGFLRPFASEQAAVTEVLIGPGRHVR